MKNLFIFRKTLTDFLIGSEPKSSLNFFVILPVIICVSLGCLCSGKTNYQTCVTPNGETLALLGWNLRTINLTDGIIRTTEDRRADAVICGDGNEIVKVSQSDTDKDRDQVKRTAVWNDSPKTYQLANDEFLEEFTGLIQNRYFVSSSRGYIEKSKNVGTIKKPNTIKYKVYTQPQIFTLEDTESGTVISHHLTREKFNLPESVFYDDLRFYPVSLIADGVQTFALINRSARTLNVYKLNVFTGELASISEQKLPPETQIFGQVRFDRREKYVVFAGNDTAANNVRIQILKLGHGENLLEKNFAGIDAKSDQPKLIFDSVNQKLGVLIEGFRFEPTRTVKEFTVLNLADAAETASLDIEQIFKDSVDSQPLYLRGDELVFAYQEEGEFAFLSNTNSVCKINLGSRAITWNTKL